MDCVIGKGRVQSGARTYTEGPVLTTKNGSFRAVPLSNRSQDILAAMRNGKSTQPGPFTDLNKLNMRWLWEHTRAQLPQVEDAVLYCMRHTYGARILMNGVSPFDIMMTGRYAAFEDAAAFATVLAALNGKGFAPTPKTTVGLVVDNGEATNV
jgi:hypothetical protein